MIDAPPQLTPRPRLRLSRADPSIPTNALPANRRAWLPLLPVLVLVALLRGYPILAGAYPTGADYGHHLLYAQQLLELGHLPDTIPFFQTGITQWSTLPGGSLQYALLSAISGAPPFDLAPATLFFSLIEVTGVYLLAWRVFARLDAALVAALVNALLPAGVDLVAWSGYINVIALALIPHVLIAFLAYWDTPNARTGALAAIVTIGMMAIHHLSALWMILTLVLFGAVFTVIQPIRTLRKLIPLGIVGVVVGLPVIIRIIDLSLIANAGSVLVDSRRFDLTRVSLVEWALTASVIAPLLLIGGLTALARMKRVPLAAKVLILAFTAVSLVFAFGWLFDLKFYYVRALFFLPLPISLGAAALIMLWRRTWMRTAVALILCVSLGFSSMLHAETSARFYTALTPKVLEAVEWLRGYSQPDEVVVVSTFLGFHMTRLLERPTLVALTPDLVGNPQEMELATDAVSIMMGLGDMDAALERRNVAYIMVKTTPPDVPDPERTMLVMSAHPQIRLLFRNSEMMIYGVER